MKSFITLVSLVTLAIANSLSNDDQRVQFPLGGHEHLTTHAGFSLDLSEQRLVQVEGKAPVWMTELEKAGFF